MTAHLRLALLAAFVGLLSACNFINIPLTLPPSEYVEVPVVGHSGDRKILILDVDGAITSGTSEENPWLPVDDSMVNQVVTKLRRAEQDKNIRAVILRVDSPGGGVTASDVIYREILRYRERTGVPVYASMLDMATSGGYYVSMAANEVYAHPTTITGSIGVIALFPQFEDLGKKIGVYFEVIKSGPNKDISGGFRNMSAEQRAILQKMIEDMYTRFVTVVAEGRPNLDVETITSLADGRIYTAQEAHELGLIDGVMYLDELVEKVKADNNLTKAKVVFYRRTSRSNYESFYAKEPASVRPGDQAPTVALVNIDGSAVTNPHRPVFQYLWVP
jgi:protease-4